MRIRPVDVHDATQFHHFYEILRAADLYERPDAPMWSEPEAAIRFREGDDSERTDVYAAFDGDTMVGVSFLAFPLVDNTDMTWGGVFVAPGLRRRGIGGQLVEHLCGATGQAGRTRLVVEASYTFGRRADHPYRLFAEKHGFVLGSTEIFRVLELPMAETLLHAWIDEAAKHHRAYTIEAYVGDLPEHIVESYCHVMNQLAVDAPTGDLEFEAEAMTPAIWRQREARLHAQNRTMYTAVGVDVHGQAVAATNMVVPGDDPAKILQWATLVLRDHRGHRLGLAIKARNLLQVQRAHPRPAKVWTSNEETNGPMVDINERMGFTPVELLGAFERKL